MQVSLLLFELMTLDNSYALVRIYEHPDTIVVSSEKLDIRRSECKGMGLFVKSGFVVNKGEILTDYPGTPLWASVDAMEHWRTADGNDYVFELGPFPVRQEDGSVKPMFVVLDGIEHANTFDTAHAAHLVNSSHPLMTSHWAQTNTVFGVYCSDLILDASVAPNIRLFLVASMRVRGLDGSSCQAELRLDYHWVLATLIGFWCCDLQCENCVENMMEFLDVNVRGRTDLPGK
jgi:hypothetical protein